jgi:hypothetical protein
MPAGFQRGAFQGRTDPQRLLGFQSDLSFVDSTMFQKVNVDSTAELPADHFNAQLIGAQFFVDGQPGDRLTIRLGYRTP